MHKKIKQKGTHRGHLSTRAAAPSVSPTIVKQIKKSKHKSSHDQDPQSSSNHSSLSFLFLSSVSLGPLCVLLLWVVTFTFFSAKDPFMLLNHGKNEWRIMRGRRVRDFVRLGLGAFSHYTNLGQACPCYRQSLTYPEICSHSFTNVYLLCISSQVSPCRLDWLSLFREEIATTMAEALSGGQMAMTILFGTCMVTYLGLEASRLRVLLRVSHYYCASCISCHQSDQRSLPSYRLA